jgi:hypothetical protein
MSAAAEQWARCRPWIEAALAHAGGCHTIEDVERGIAEQRYQLWPGKRCALVTEVHEFPRRKLFHIFLAGGDLDELRDMQPWLESFARFLGCSGLTLSGRPGWDRALKGQGWQRAAVHLVLPLSEKEREQEPARHQ